MDSSRPTGLSGAIPAAGGALTGALAEPALALSTDQDVLDLLHQADRLVSFAVAARAEVIREVERREAAEREARCSTAEHLRRTRGHTLQRCRALVRGAVREGQFPRLGEAAAQGEVSGQQIAVIARMLDELPDDLSADQLRKAEQTMIELASDFGPTELMRLGWHLLEVIAPERAEEIVAEQLQTEEAEARKKRGLSLSSDGHGSMHIKGRLPISDGEELAAVLNAHAESRWKQQRDEEGGAETLPMDKALLLADALMTLVRGHQAHQQGPAHGGDRPRVTVFVHLDALISGLGEMALNSGACLTATEARRLACDCELVPMVLNANGVPLDVGRSRRLVPPMIRAALVARDRSCVFPGCDRHPTECEAHHIKPWWADGITSLDNLVLLCPRHHRKVEPGRGQAWDTDDPHRWRVRLGNGQLPEIIPPLGYDPDRQPLRHDRFGVMRR